MGILDGRVVLVNGGGRGIGMECALLAAREGASVIVNDPGSDINGTNGGSDAPANSVVAAIRREGGQAVANTESITDMGAARRMLEQALDEYGRLDAIINPAGILRDGMFHKMEEAAWDAVIEVHLRGAFNLARATIEYFRGRQAGSYVLFTSTTGLIGNIGQANYAAAKLGVVGLSKSIAMEGAIRNVRSNIVAPFAFTRMVGTIRITDEASAQRVQRMKDGMRAEQVAPLAVALCAPDCDVSGQIFCVRGNEVMLFSQPRPVKSLTRIEGWTPRALSEQAFPAMRSAFTDLEPSASVFPYDPV